jgi:hypothetical protein
MKPPEGNLGKDTQANTTSLSQNIHESASTQEENTTG